MQQSVYQMIPVSHSTVTQSNKEKQMADKGDKSQSTDFVPFDRVTKGGIPASMPVGGGVPVTSGTKATFAGGKKSVSK
jgi:hypothetical protein